MESLGSVVREARDKRGGKASEKILVVDDSSDALGLINRILENHGYDVRCASHGREALEILEAWRPNLILLDVDMPGINGFETCTRIKANPLLRDIPVVFLTGRSEAEDIVAAFKSGAADFIVKPFSQVELLCRVDTHLTVWRLAADNERLLRNMLPGRVVERLRAGESPIADRYDDLSVLFVDVAAFTRIAAALAPSRVVALLGEMFTEFDQLVQGAGMTKIKTIGDAYLVVGGLGPGQEDHLATMATLALDFQQVRVTNPLDGGVLAIRGGLHVGPAVAGVIGITALAYDVWGDTVNVASRLESHGEIGRIHVSDAVCQRLLTRFEFEKRGVIEIKGKGPLLTHFLERMRDEPGGGGRKFSSDELPATVG